MEHNIIKTRLIDLIQEMKSLGVDPNVAAQEATRVIAFQMDQNIRDKDREHDKEVHDKRRAEIVDMPPDDDDEYGDLGRPSY